MDTITKYVYAYGRTENLREGNLDSMPVEGSLEGSKILHGEPVGIPRFVGIYQMFGPIPDTKQENKMNFEFNYNFSSSGDYVVSVVVYKKESGYGLGTANVHAN